MKDLLLPAKELITKAKSARTDVADVATLRMIPIPESGISFFVNRSLYMWMPLDGSDDDGISSVKPGILSTDVPGRYRRLTVAFPFMKV